MFVLGSLLVVFLLYTLYSLMKMSSRCSRYEEEAWYKIKDKTANEILNAPAYDKE